MDIIVIVSLTLLGLALGSFLSLTIDRLPRGQSLIYPPSHCDGCHQRLRPRDLVPIASYLWLLGRCRHCGYRIPPRAPLVEAIAAAGCGLIAYRYGLTPVTAILVFYLAVAIHITFVDLERSLILNRIVLLALPLALATFPFSPLGQGFSLGEAYLRSLAGAGAGFGVMLLVYVGSRGRLGAGDVKLAALLGAMLGFPQILAGLLLGFTAGGVLAVALLMLKLRRRTDAIPLGPMLLGSAAAVLVTGVGIYDWYLGFFR